MFHGHRFLSQFLRNKQVITLCGVGNKSHAGKDAAYCSKCRKMMSTDLESALNKTNKEEHSTHR